MACPLLITKCAGLGMTSLSGTAPTRPAGLLVMHPILGQACMASNNNNHTLIITINWILRTVTRA